MEWGPQSLGRWRHRASLLSQLEFEYPGVGPEHAILSGRVAAADEEAVSSLALSLKIINGSSHMPSPEAVKRAPKLSKNEIICSINVSDRGDKDSSCYLEAKNKDGKIIAVSHRELCGC